MNRSAIEAESFPSAALPARRLRILFLANRVPFPIRDGQARRTYHILRGLGEVHDVDLLSMYERPEEGHSDTVAHLHTFCARVELLPAPSKTPSVGMAARILRSLVSRDPYTIWRHYSSEYVRRVRAAVQTKRYDVVHCDILPLAYAVRGLEMPFCALTDHDVSYVKARRLARQRRNPAAKLFIHYEALKLRRLEGALAGICDLIVTVSEVDQELLRSLNPRARFAVVENGVDVAAFSPEPDAIEAHTLVWVGGFHHYPNYEAMRFFLQSVYPAVKRAVPAVRLFIVGDGAADRLGSLVANDPSVVMTGYVEDPAPFIQRGSVFVAPILSGGGTKLKILEAMAAGKAIVSTSIGIEGIEALDGKHCLIANQPSAFIEKVVLLLSDRSYAAHLGASARRIVETKYDWRGICHKLSGLYIDAINHGPERN